VNNGKLGSPLSIFNSVSVPHMRQVSLSPEPSVVMGVSEIVKTRYVICSLGDVLESNYFLYIFLMDPSII
jgi:hypothetical protein